jgi:hypothetical protein
MVDSMVDPFIKFAGLVEDSFLNAGSFMALNRRVIDGKVFDETFINGYEDVHLSMRLRDDANVVNFRIRQERGPSLGASTSSGSRGYLSTRSTSTNC